MTLILLFGLVLAAVALKPAIPKTRLRRVAGSVTPVSAGWRTKLPSARRAERERSKSRAVELSSGLAAALEAGLAPRAAVGDVIADVAAGDDGPLLAAVGSAAREGADVAAVLLDSPLRHWRALGVAWRVGEDSGAAFGPILDRVAGALRTEQAVAREAQSALATAQATARLLAVLPLFGIVLGRGAGGDPMHFLISCPAGYGCLALGLSFEVAGLLWTRRILAKAGGLT